MRPKGLQRSDCLYLAGLGDKLGRAHAQIVQALARLLGDPPVRVVVPEALAPGSPFVVHVAGFGSFHAQAPPGLDAGAAMDMPLPAQLVLAGDGFADEALQQKYGFEEPKCCCMSKLAHKIMCHFSFWSGCGCQFLCWSCFPFWWPVTALYAFFLSFYWCVHAFGRCCVSVCNKEA